MSTTDRHDRRIPSGFVGGMIAYAILIALAVSILQSYRHPPGWLGYVLALPAAGAAAYAIISQLRLIARRDGVERFAQTESAAYAFWVTVLAALAYGLLEAFSHAPHLSMWAVWSFGMITWGAALTLLNRRLR